MSAPNFNLQDMFLPQEIPFDFPMPIPATPHLPTPTTPAFYDDKPETPFEHIMFVPMADEPQIRSLPIRDLLLVAHDVPEPVHGQTRSSWSFYISVGGNIYIAVSLLKTINHSLFTPHGRRGALIVHATTSNHFRDAQQIYRISVHPRATVNDVINAIVRSGRHRFEFDANGRGARGWFLDTIDLFHANGVITNVADAAKASEVLHLEWSRLNFGISGTPWSLSRLCAKSPPSRKTFTKIHVQQHRQQ
ncbi:hypothetical protein F5X68DRAFT_226466 [Plectosphaerella plurivora]|uniref:DUF7770 domain-containing protein n=1 Tax=Plectosphaerella plurivora TaxID=936078 RepID=A0A9P8VNB7_9PEZI|nr:hypothetical protein F5X68DRAFT_226466 [Plectosphaerella plurivora]